MKTTEGAAYKRYLDVLMRHAEEIAQADTNELSPEECSIIYASDALLDLWESGASVADIRKAIKGNA